MRQALAATGRELMTGLRDGDVIARYGGEEFVVLLPGADREQAMARARQLRERCARAVVSTPQGRVGRTVSVGVAFLRDLAPVPATAGATADALLRAADDALYAAKLAGRDQIVITA